MSGIVCLRVCVSRFFRRLAFEVARALHFAAAVTVLTTLFFHAAHARPARIYLITGASSWGFTPVLHNKYLAYRSLGTQSTILKYEENNDVQELLISDGLGNLDQDNMHTLRFLESAPQQCFSLTRSSLGGTSRFGGLTSWFHRKTGLAEISYFTEAARLKVD